MLGPKISATWLKILSGIAITIVIGQKGSLFSIAEYSAYKSGDAFVAILKDENEHTQSHDLQRQPNAELTH